MLSIIEKPKAKAAKKLSFQKPPKVQKTGVEMLIALNTTDREYLIGPEVGEDAQILVTKIKPHFFFNPSYTVPESLNTSEDDSIIEISYQNYLGTEKKLVVTDENKKLRTAIDHLVNGRPRKKRAKKNANES